MLLQGELKQLNFESNTFLSPSFKFSTDIDQANRYLISNRSMSPYSSGYSSCSSYPSSPVPNHHENYDYQSKRSTILNSDASFYYCGNDEYNISSRYTDFSTYNHWVTENNLLQQNSIPNYSANKTDSTLLENTPSLPITNYSVYDNTVENPYSIQDSIPCSKEHICMCKNRKDNFEFDYNNSYILNNIQTINTAQEKNKLNNESDSNSGLHENPNRKIDEAILFNIAEIEGLSISNKEISRQTTVPNNYNYLYKNSMQMQLENNFQDQQFQQHDAKHFSSESLLNPG